MLRVALWNALLLVRVPVQLVLRVLMVFHLAAAVAGVVVVFTGTGVPAIDDHPAVFRIFAPAFMFGIYALLSWVSYSLDRMIFKVTPEDRLLFLWN